MNRRKTDRTGATLVEFAIVFPVFLLILTGMVEFSRMNVMRHTADNAAYEAARAAIVPGATAAQATAEADRLLAIVGTRGATVDIQPSVIDLDTDEVTVSISVPMRQNTLVFSQFTGDAVLRAESTLRTERVRTR